MQKCWVKTIVLNQSINFSNFDLQCHILSSSNGVAHSKRVCARIMRNRALCIKLRRRDCARIMRNHALCIKLRRRDRVQGNPKISCTYPQIFLGALPALLPNWIFVLIASPPNNLYLSLSIGLYFIRHPVLIRCIIQHSPTYLSTKECKSFVWFVCHIEISPKSLCLFLLHSWVLLESSQWVVVGVHWVGFIMFLPMINKLLIIEQFFNEKNPFESKLEIIEQFFTQNSFQSKLEIIPKGVWVWLLLLLESP